MKKVTDFSQNHSSHTVTDTGDRGNRRMDCVHLARFFIDVSGDAFFVSLQHCLPRQRIDRQVRCRSR